MEAYLQTLLDFQNSNKNSAPKSESERIDEMVNPKLGFTPVSMGTTLAALKCKDGIIVAADSRTSAGIMISNDFTDKIQQISKCIVSMQCGSAASSQKLVDIARQEAMLYERLNGRQIPTVALAKRISSYLYKYQELLASAFIFAGYDSVEGFQAYMCNRGNFYKMNAVSMGSGSIFITENLAVHFDEENTVQNSLEFMQKQILHAINADNSSGGVLNSKIVTKNGVENVALFDGALRLDTSKASLQASI